jgi:hypothetical protein
MRRAVWQIGCLSLTLLGFIAAPVVAQQTPAPQTPPAAQPTTPAPVTPSVRVGATLYADYTYTSSPETLDADGNAIHPNQFNIGRSYLNINGTLSRFVAFRITPDVARESGATSSLNGSLVFRIKYAFAQFNLDDWVGAGSWSRFGIQQTPLLDFAEGIYRYRFQGTMFAEREGYLVSSDGGASFRYNLPSNYGEIHAGVFNGENYNRAEVNDQKAVQVRGTLRPVPASPTPLRGLRFTAFYDADRYLKNGERNRLVIGPTFEHRYVNAGLEYLATTDQTSVTKPEADGRGFSIWATPRVPSGWEALLRYDHFKPDTSMDSQIRTRTIVGVAYWFKYEGPLATALLLDYDGVTFKNFVPAQPKQQRITLHGLVNF